MSQFYEICSSVYRTGGINGQANKAAVLGLGARASKFCTLVTNTHMFSVFNLLYVTLLASRIYVAHRFFKNLCISDLGQIAHLGARSDCFQHKVIHLN